MGIDFEPFSRKPSGREIGMLKKRSGYCWREIALEELADLNGNMGHTITPAHLEGGISEKNCTAMQLFVLDFDHGCTFAEVKRKCDNKGLKIAYAYHTFSSDEAEERFRVAFVCEELVEDIFIVKVMLKMLYGIFPECDNSCKNLDRMFFGGKGLIYLDTEARFALMQLHMPLLESFGSSNHYAENMRSFSKNAGVLMENGHLAMGCLKDKNAVLGGNVDPAVIHITGESSKTPFFIAERSLVYKCLHQGKTCKKKLYKINIKEGDTPCRLYNEFREGKFIDHDARFALFTNFLYINGGIKHFMETMQKFYSEESYEKWKKYPSYCKGYHPHNCTGDFCPYYGKCENEGSIIKTMRMDRRIYCEPEEYVSMEEAEKCLQENLREAFGSVDSGMHLIMAQTGLGKTRAYVRLAAENPRHKFLIALPTNSLKEEVRRALLSSGIPEKSIFMTASVHGNPFIPPEVQSRISIAHNRGLHNMTAKIIRNYYEENKEELSGKKAVEEECDRILLGIKKVQDERIVVTTHAYLAQLDGSFLKGYTVIIDEDFLQLQVFNRMYQVSVECLKELESMGVPGYSLIASEILRTGKGEYRRAGWRREGFPLSEEEQEGMHGFGTCDNINDLMEAGAYVRMEDKDTEKEVIKYFCPLHLPEMKYIVLSATFNYSIYEKYFDGKTKVYTYQEKKAKYQGNLQQYTYHSLGRADLAEKKQVFDLAKEMLGDQDLNIISFKMFEPEDGKRLNPADIHFGNSTGINSLEGKDLAVIGTPYKVEEYYKLIGCYLGADVNCEGDKRVALRRVKYKGKRFLITSFKNSLLREIQLYSIESELEQCVGRARLLRHDCSIYVFSCFPCEQAEIHIRDYLCGYSAGEQEGSQKEKNQGLSASYRTDWI